MVMDCGVYSFKSPDFQRIFMNPVPERRAMYALNSWLPTLVARIGYGKGKVFLLNHCARISQ
jgi:hypothetical protein